MDFSNPFGILVPNACLYETNDIKRKNDREKQLPTDYNPIPIRVLGFLELLGIIGIIVPYFTNTLTILTPITAVCFAVVMVGAFVVHAKKHHYTILPFIVIAFVLSVIVAWFRFAG